MHKKRQLLATALGILFGLEGLLAQTNQASPALRGTLLSQPAAAADFSLVDQKGNSFRMSSTKGEGMSGMEDEHSQGLSKAELSTAQAIIKAFSGGYEVSHSAPFWIIDTEGQLRAVLDANALPSDIVADLRALM